MKKIFSITSVFVLLFSYQYGFTQTQSVRGGGIANVKLETGSRNVNQRKDSTQEVPLGNIKNSSISADGKVIVTNGRIIRLDGRVARGRLFVSPCCSGAPITSNYLANNPTSGQHG